MKLKKKDHKEGVFVCNESKKEKRPINNHYSEILSCREPQKKLSVLLYYWHFLSAADRNLQVAITY